MNSKLAIIFIILIVSKLSFATDALPELKITKIDNDVYLHTSFKDVKGYGLLDSNGLVVINNKDAYIIDTPWSPEDTEKLVNWIKEQGYIIKGSVSTHSHEDRTAGIGFLNSQSIPTYASKITNELLHKSGKTEATNIFKNKSFWLLKNKIQVFYPGGGHTKDNEVVWLAQHNILFGGCLVRALETNSLGNTADAVINEWANSTKKLESKYGSAKLVIPGHGKSGDVSLLAHTVNLAKQAQIKSTP